MGGGVQRRKTKLLSCKHQATLCPLGLDLTLPITSGCWNNEGEAGAGRDGGRTCSQQPLVVGHRGCGGGGGGGGRGSSNTLRSLSGTFLPFEHNE